MSDRPTPPRGASIPRRVDLDRIERIRLELRTRMANRIRRPGPTLAAHIERSRSNASGTGARPSSPRGGDRAG